MHGVRKDSRQPESEAQRDEKLKKISKYVKLSSTVLELHKAASWNAQGFEICGKLIELNPDFYTLWNYRRKALQVFFSSGADKTSLCSQELELTEKALKRNPKSYCAWHHRLWVIDRGTSDLEREIALCATFLGSDARNFHCWDYRGQIFRRLPAERHKESIRREFDFTTAKINENFSNYSAWHYRSVFLPQIEAEDEWALLDKEFELVRQAFFTEPEDQSAWLYHRWLVSRCTAFCGFSTSVPSLSELRPGLQGLFPALAASASSDKKEETRSPDRLTDVLVRELKSCRELLELEPNCKMALLTSAYLLHVLRGLSAQVPPAPDSEAYALAAAAATEVPQLLTRLSELDPLRTQFYSDMASRQRTHC